MNRVRSLVLSLSTGYVLMFFSEHLFWARARPGDALGGWLATWLAYSLLAFIFLSAVHHYRVHSLEALFVAGALVGWLGEGVLVQTLYDLFPLQISWTGLAWHSLISVCIGWYGLRRALAEPGAGRATVWCLGLGVFWGFWAIFWRVEEPGAQASLEAFAAFAFLTTAILAVSLWVCEMVDPRAFSPSGLSIAAALGALLVIFYLGTLPIAPMAIVTLPLLLALVLVALARNRACETGDDVLSLPGSRPLRPKALLALAIIPSAATLIYAAAIAFDLRWRTNWVVYLVTMPAGFLLFGASWIRLMRRRRVCP
jgi:hypothetical protein